MPVHKARKVNMKQTAQDKMQTKLNTLLVKVLQTAYHNAREYGLPLKDETNGDYSVHFWDGVLESIKGFNKEYDELLSLIETERKDSYQKGLKDARK